MASPTKPSTLSAMLFVLVVMAEPEAAFQLEADNNTYSHFPPLLDCSPPASPAPSTTFRTNVLSLLAALPSTAAAAPPGSASTRSRGAADDGHRDRAFVRGLCFGAASGERGPSPSYPAAADCLACLTAAGADVAAGCNGSRRGGAWRAGCFVSYADTNATSAREDAFRGWFYDDGDSPDFAAALESQCIADRAPEECARCLNESARAAAELRRGNRLSRIHGDAVVVVGYGCYLRVLVEDPTPSWQVVAFGILAVAVVIVLAEICGLLSCVRRRGGQTNPNPA